MVTPDNLTQHKKETLHNEFQEKVDEYIYTEINPDYTMLSSSHLQDSRSFKWRGFHIEPTYNYYFNLNNNIDNIWNNFKKNTRGDIQRAQRRGFSVREGNKEDMLRIYELLEKRYEEQKRKVHVSKEYLLEMYDAFYPSNLKIFVVEHEGNVVTGNIEVYFKQNAITWIGIAKAAQHANDFLTWECLKYANSIDISDYGIMGVAGDERLSKFYSKFNPDLGVYETYAFSKSWLKI
jgi:lipid II:glycine glycyltransferase (peptidoglycan interpeptide bridge formation enzyme)